MGLRITRAADSLLYGGFELDGDDLEGSFDHRIWFRRFTSTEKKKSALINIETKDGITESVMLTTGEDSAIELAPSVWLSLMSIHEHWADRPPYCDVCGRGDKQSKRMIPQGRFGVDAPRSYQVIRDDARKR